MSGRSKPDNSDDAEPSFEERILELLEEILSEIKSVNRQIANGDCRGDFNP